MRNRNSITVGVALLFVTLLAAVGASGQNADNTHPVQVPAGQKLKIQGIVSIRNGDTFKVRDPAGAD